MGVILQRDRTSLDYSSHKVKTVHHSGNYHGEIL